MNDEWSLHVNLKNKQFIANLPLCCVLLENESHYPWIILVPRRPQVARIFDLTRDDQLQLLSELDLSQKIVWDSFSLTQLNVAAIGNKTPQLHIHIIGRREDDPAWPGTVWDHPVRTMYSEVQKERMVHLLQKRFNR